MKKGIAERLYAAEGLLACALAASFGGMILTSRLRESSVRESLLLASSARSLQAAALSCREYLDLVLASRDFAKAKALGRESSKRLGQTRLYALRSGGPGPEQLKSLSGFLRASLILLEKVSRLEGQGRLRESSDLYHGGVRPLIEGYLASSLEGTLKAERARRLETLRRARLWTKASLAALAATAASSLLLFFIWSRRFARYLLRNLESIRRAVAAVASGNLQLALRPEREDELGVLTRALNEMAARLEQTQRRLLEAERLAAFGELAGGAARVLNNPLSAVIGYASLLIESERLSAEDRKDLRIILDEAKRCDLILRNLGQFSGQNGSSKERLSLGDLLARMADFLKPSLETQGVSLDLRIEQPLPMAEGNPRKLQHAFYNLITNALQAVRGRPGARIALSTRREGDWVCGIVEDNGEGIAPENLAKIFEPFFTTRKPGEGAGLGLSSALAIVTEHRGQLLVKSEPGEGSRFELRLPALASEASPQGGGRATGRILVVDDEKSILALVERVLTREGFEVQCASEAREALRAIESRGFDLILSDYCLPELDGFWLYQEVRAKAPGLAERFLFSTGEIASKDFQAFAQGHGIPVLLKPFDLAELVRTVRSRLESFSPILEGSPPIPGGTERS